MSSYVILVFTVAVVFDLVFANVVLKQSAADKDLLFESNDSSTTHEESLTNNSAFKQKSIETNENSETMAIKDHPHQGPLEIDIEENVQSSIEQFDFQDAINNEVGLQEAYDNNNYFNIQEQSIVHPENEFNIQEETIVHPENEFNIQEQTIDRLENDFELVKEGDYYYRDVVNKDPNEIMDAAAGFVPIPIFRKKKKQTPRTKYATRRYTYRRPYGSRKQYYFYPYYRYRPSSLRYYYI